MRKTDFGVGLAAIVIILGGCGGNDPGAEDGGAADGGPVFDADSGGDSGVPDASSTEDAGASDAAPQPGDAGAGTASVRWVTVTEPHEVDGDRALDFLFEYELLIEGDPFVYSLSLERCTHIAGTTETCETQARSNVPGAGYLRWGVDPTTYAVGENVYTFRLLLDRGAERIDEATLGVEVNVISCETCIGAAP